LNGSSGCVRRKGSSRLGRTGRRGSGSSSGSGSRKSSLTAGARLIGSLGGSFGGSGASSIGGFTPAYGGTPLEFDADAVAAAALTLPEGGADTSFGACNSAGTAMEVDPPVPLKAAPVAPAAPAAPAVGLNVSDLLPPSPERTRNAPLAIVPGVAAAGAAVSMPVQGPSVMAAAAAGAAPPLLQQSVALLGDKLGFEVWEQIQDIFDRLPLAAVVDHDIFCSYSGIPPEAPGTAAANLTSPVSSRTPSLRRRRTTSAAKPPGTAGGIGAAIDGAAAVAAAAAALASGAPGIAAAAAAAELNALQEIMSLPPVLPLLPPGADVSARQLQVAQSLLWGVPLTEPQEKELLQGSSHGSAVAVASVAAAAAADASGMPAPATFGRKAVADFLSRHNLSFVCRGGLAADGTGPHGVALSQAAKVFTVACSPPRRSRAATLAAGADAAAAAAAAEAVAGAAVINPGGGRSSLRPLSLGRSSARNAAAAGGGSSGAGGNSSRSPGGGRSRPWSMTRKRGNAAEDATFADAEGISGFGACGCLLIDFDKIVAVGRAPNYQRIHHKSGSGATGSITVAGIGTVPELEGWSGSRKGSGGNAGVKTMTAAEAVGAAALGGRAAE
ncbi:unnamed protein product, partial [Phaeothamnion confervicola]